MPRRPARRRHGFIFIEMIFLLGLIAVAAVISMQLYVEMTHDQARMLQQREAQQRFDLALRPLRTDVWNAAGATVDEAGVLHLKGPGGKEIQWRAGEQLNRTAEGEPRAWDELHTKLSFAVHGNTVVLHEEPAETDPAAGDITMPMVGGTLKGNTP